MGGLGVMGWGRGRGSGRWGSRGGGVGSKGDGVGPRSRGWGSRG